jgi:hypothetical protein
MMELIESLTTWLTANQVRSFYLLFFVAFLINRMPFIGVFFRTLNTVLHETGHAIGAIVTSGEVVKIEINNDTSGLAQTKSRSKLSAFITTFIGYPFAALLSSVFLVMTMNGHHMMVAFILLSLMLIDLILFVRNVFGIIWLLLFSLLIIVAMYYGGASILKVLMLFACMISFTETISSTLHITAVGLSQPRKAGDMYNLEKSTGIPAGFWALVNLTVTGVIIFYVAVNYFPGLSAI